MGEEVSVKLLGDGVRSGELDGGVFFGDAKGELGDPTEKIGLHVFCRWVCREDLKLERSFQHKGMIISKY